MHVFEPPGWIYQNHSPFALYRCVNTGLFSSQRPFSNTFKGFCCSVLKVLHHYVMSEFSPNIHLCKQKHRTKPSFASSLHLQSHETSPKIQPSGQFPSAVVFMVLKQLDSSKSPIQPLLFLIEAIPLAQQSLRFLGAPALLDTPQTLSAAEASHKSKASPGFAHFQQLLPDMKQNK